MSSHSLRLTPRAERDLGAILQVSFETWGSEQRNARATAIASAFDTLTTLTTFPEIGRARDELGKRVRSDLVKPHAVYYRIDDDTITILRIAHQRMDMMGKLEGPGAPARAGSW
jgi:toxin ParE1/3/4